MCISIYLSIDLCMIHLDGNLITMYIYICATVYLHTLLYCLRSPEETY